MQSRVAYLLFALFACLALVSAESTAKKCSERSLASHQKHHTAHRTAKHNRKVHHKAAHHKAAHHKTTHHKATQHKSTSNNKASTISVGSLSHKLSTLRTDCGDLSPSSKITTGGGPMGLETMLNCGITGDGWKPPMLTFEMLSMASLDSPQAQKTYARCSKFIPIFEKVAAKYNIPPIMLAAFAMQESSCNPSVRGDNGQAFGLMQITKDKCGGAPNGDCSEPNFNIDMGAKTFIDGVNSAGGNVLAAVGEYNGWQPGMTLNQMKAMGNEHCDWQPNADYHQQFFNGWCQGYDAYSLNLGTIQNLARCGDN